jgi:hypothetical protein
MLELSMPPYPIRSRAFAPDTCAYTSSSLGLQDQVHCDEQRNPEDKDGTFDATPFSFSSIFMFFSDHTLFVAQSESTPPND